MTVAMPARGMIVAVLGALAMAATDAHVPGARTMKSVGCGVLVFDPAPELPNAPAA
jgi:hypothetical protein